MALIVYKSDTSEREYKVVEPLSEFLEEVIRIRDMRWHERRSLEEWGRWCTEVYDHMHHRSPELMSPDTWWTWGNVRRLKHDTDEGN